MVSETEINERIAREQAKIEVPSYQDEVWVNTWKRRAGALWGLGAVAATAGAVMGLLAPVAPYLLANVPLSLPIMGQSAAIFAGLGLSTGLVVGGIMGPSAGAASAAIREYERRQIAREIDGAIRANPEAEVMLVNDPVVQKEEDKEKNIKFSDYVNIKTMLLFAAIGTVGGLIFAGAFFAAGGATGATFAQSFLQPAAAFVLGESAKSVAAVTAYSAGVGALFGAQFGVSYARITNQVVNFANDLLGGKAFGEPWPKRINTPSPKPVLSPVVVVREAEPAVEIESKRTFADAAKKLPSYEALVTQAINQTNAEISRG